MKRNQGITLIALVITVIVLLILAGVSIATLTGEGGILNKATQAKEETEIKQGEEAIKLKISEAQIEKKALINLEFLENFLENDEKITLSDVNEEEIILEYGDYVYRIDDKLIVTYLGTKEEWQKNSYRITTDLTEGITIDSKRRRVQKGESYQATILVEEGIEVSKIEVKMGEEAIPIDTETKKIRIEQVTDNIVITARKLVNIEIFDYMRKNNLTPELAGFQATWTSCESKTFTNQYFAAGHGSGTANFEAKILIEGSALEKIGLTHLLSANAACSFTVTSGGGNGPWAEGKGSVTITYTDGKTVVDSFEGKRGGARTENYNLSLNCDLSKTIKSIQIILAGWDGDYGSTTTKITSLTLKSSI